MCPGKSWYCVSADIFCTHFCFNKLKLEVLDY